jgi:hypothetical protein
MIYLFTNFQNVTMFIITIKLPPCLYIPSFTSMVDTADIVGKNKQRGN